jgi:hypothetical protein
MQFTGQSWGWLDAMQLQEIHGSLGLYLPVSSTGKTGQRRGDCNPMRTICKLATFESAENRHGARGFRNEWRRLSFLRIAHTDSGLRRNRWFL